MRAFPIAWARQVFTALLMSTTFIPTPARALQIEPNFLAAAGQFMHDGLSIEKPLLSAALSKSANQLEVMCLAVALYHEARGEKTEGQKAVAQVILNRVKSDAYPDTICGVVYENATHKNACQFSYACDGLPDFPKDKSAFDNAMGLAKIAVKHGMFANGLEPKSGDEKQTRKSQITHYHTKAVSPGWGKQLEPIKTIGSHIFYRSERVAKSL